MPDRSITDILGSPDDLKFRSSLTLFQRAPGESLFEQCLELFYGGEPDQRTLDALAATR